MKKLKNGLLNNTAIMPQSDTPLILTLQLDQKDFYYFNMLRKEHFPQHINYIEAHITLFHHLPGKDYDTLADQLNIFCSRIPVLSLKVAALKMIGNGVAYFIEDAYLSSLHNRLQQLWQPVLINQDKQKLRPHITIQNKVTVFKAQTLHNELSRDFVPFTITTTGMQLWAYLGGPWQLLQTFPFIATNC